MKKIFLRAVEYFSKVEHLVTTLVIIGLVLTMAVQKGCNNTKFESQRATIDSLTLANQRLDSIKNQQGQTIQTQTAIITNDQKTFTKFTNDIFDLKKKNERQVKAVIAYYTQKTSTRVDSLKIPFTDTAKQKRFADSVEQKCAEVIKYIRDSTLQVPKTDSLETKDFKFNYTIEKTGLTINRAEFPDSQYFRIIERKGGFFRKVNGKLKFHQPKTIEFQSLHTNPYIYVTSQNSILYMPLKKLHLLRTGIILGAGVYLGSLF